jgi:hypothetical protein
MHLRGSVVLLIAVAACGGPAHPPPAAAAPAPTGRAITIGTAGDPLAARLWTPAAPARAAVLAIADRDERSAAAIALLAEQLAADGAMVVAIERGEIGGLPFRGTEPPSGAAHAAAWIRREVGATPLFVVGHAHGGTAALRLAQDDAGTIAGVVAVEPVLTADDVLIWIGTSSALELLGSDRAHPLPPLWAHTRALDIPVLVIEDHRDGRAIAVAHDLLGRSATRDGTVHPVAEPATATTEVVNWIGVRVGGAPPPGEVAPPAPSSPGLAVSIGAAVTWARSDGDNDSSGSLRALLSHGRVGWAGVFAARSAEAELMPLGVGARLGAAGQLALVGGLGRGDDVWVAPVEASAELPLGRHLRGLATARVAWELDDERAGDLAAGVDDLHLRLGLRIPGDRYLWQRVVAGSGLYLAGSYRRLGDADIVGLELGLHVWGSR